MLIRNMLNKYYNEADDGAGAGGAGDNAEVRTYTQAEVDALTSGLKLKNDELLTEKKTASQKAKEAEAERVKFEQEAAKKSGELDKFEASLRGEFSKTLSAKDLELEGLRGHVLGESKKAVLGSLSGDFIEPESLDLISQLVKTEFDGTTVKTQFLDFAGNVITTDASEFKKWMGNHPAISHLMKADGATGGGALGGKGSGSGANTTQYKALKDLPVR